MAVKASARLAAFGVLNDIINKNMVTDAALTKNKMFASLESRDRAFARLLVTSCLRRYGQVQKMIDHCLSKPVDRLLILSCTGSCAVVFPEYNPCSNQYFCRTGKTTEP